MHRKIKVLALSAATAFAVAPSVANAALTINFVETGSDLGISFSGSVDTAGATFAGTSSGGSSFIWVNNGELRLRPDQTTFYRVFRLISPPQSFGTGSTFSISNATGDPLVFYGANFSDGQPGIGLADGYVSGSALAGGGTILGQSFASAGFNQGSHTFALPSDTITVNIGSTILPPGAVPEPATWAMLIAGFGAVGGAMRRRKAPTLSYA